MEPTRTTPWVPLDALMIVGKAAVREVCEPHLRTGNAAQEWQRFGAKGERHP